MKTIILTKKLYAGIFKVTVYHDHIKLGYFKVTDMQILTDIQEMTNNGFESNLSHFNTFKAIEEYCINEAAPLPF